MLKFCFVLLFLNCFGSEINDKDFFDSFKSLKTSFFFKSSEIFFNKKYFILSDKNGIYLSNINSFTPVLKKDFSFSPKVCVSNDCVFYNDLNCNFVCIDFNGKEIFSRKLDSVGRSDFIVDENERIYFVTTSNTIYCYKNNGILLWINDTLNKTKFLFSSKIKLIDNFIVFYNDDNKIAILDKRNGEVIKNFETTEKIFETCIFENFDDLFLFCEDSIYSLSLNNLDDIKKSEKIIFNEKCFLSFENEKLILKFDDEIFETENFKIFDDFIVLKCSNNIVLFDFNKIKISKYKNVNYKKILYKDGVFVIFDGNNVKFNKI